ncbi:unnamed protein product [Lathyrus sativus]|nr:unnamed protein product [Lathyrus sativus]
MVKNSSNLRELSGFQVKNSIHFDLLKFADDIIILCEPSWNNLWSLKGILRGLELVSSLCINLSKSKLIGINFEEDFIQAAPSFLTCNVGSVPFSFLRIQVGVNRRRKEVWFSILSTLHKTFSYWRGLHLEESF